MNLKKTIIILLICFFGFILFFGGYARWNSANPDKTCASCHEINPSVNEWHTSAHRNIRCTECHGTAMSNGIHSLKEKADMVFSHLGEKKQHEEIRMTEKQVLELSDKCAKCHQTEYAKWLSGGHSANYADIFMNGKHNLEEKPYWACLRCHGMFYDGDIKTLLQKPEKADGVWKLNDMKKASDPTIPCLSCHQIHSENEVLGVIGRHDVPKEISYERLNRNPSISWYIRADKRHIRTDKLMKIPMMDHGNPIKVSNDSGSKLCQQCHSPNFVHQTGSEDDRTPTGVHEGISCMACHSPHSNDSRSSCKNCHPAISNCKIDVTTMNTTYLDINSPNNIHSVSCSSCHTNVQELRARKLKKEIN
ncbi:MAG TPA: NapC/NirT family cytochrome c [Prolixibacteraceae bacterium]